MTTLFMDPFSQYAGNIGYMLQGPWASFSTDFFHVTPFLQAAPWDTTGAVSLMSNSFGGGGGPWYLAKRVLPAAKNALIVSLRYGVGELPGANNQKGVMSFINGAGTVIATLWVSTTGAMYLTNAAGTNVASTQGPVIVASNWHHLEFKLDVSGGTATFVLRVDDATGTGTPAINASGLTGITGSPIAGMWALVENDSTATYQIERRGCMRDLIVRDTSGSVNNGFNGDEFVAALFADADTSHAGWTPRFYHEFGSGILRLLGGELYTASSASTDLGSGDFTIEGFHRFSALPSAGGYHTFMSKWDSSVNKRSWRFIYGGSSFNANCLQFDLSTDGTAAGIVTPIVFPWVPDLNTWYHIALVRTAGELLLFINGNQVGLPAADAHTYYAGTEPMGIGAEFQGTSSPVGSTNFYGFMDETRLTVGYARYTSSFTPSGPFPRGSGADAHWSNVAFLAGYDNGISDESSYARGIGVLNGAASVVVNDGPAVGSWSTLGLTKTSPDDGSFMTAPYTAATGVLTMTVQPANNDTVTVGTTDGATPAVYTFKNAISTAFDVLIDTTAQNTLLNLYTAINGGTGAGTKYGTGTTANFDVTSTQLPVGQIEVSANVLGTVGNAIATSATGTSATWGGTHLTGGLNIPGPSDFRVQRPPPHTTIISAVQLNSRMFKSDAGPCSVEMGLVGPLGGVTYGTPHPLTTSGIFYGDIVEADPDTSGPISPSTIINGALRFNRTA